MIWDSRFFCLHMSVIRQSNLFQWFFSSKSFEAVWNCFQINWLELRDKSSVTWNWDTVAWTSFFLVNRGQIAYLLVELWWLNLLCSLNTSNYLISKQSSTFTFFLMLAFKRILFVSFNCFLCFTLVVQFCICFAQLFVIQL